MYSRTNSTVLQKHVFKRHSDRYITFHCFIKYFKQIYIFSIHANITYWLSSFYSLHWKIKVCHTLLSPFCMHMSYFFKLYLPIRLHIKFLISQYISIEVSVVCSILCWFCIRSFILAFPRHARWIIHFLIFNSMNLKFQPYPELYTYLRRGFYEI